MIRNKLHQKLLYLLIISFMVAAISPEPIPSQAAGYSCWVEPSYVRVMQSSRPDALARRSIVVGAARGEYEGVQLVIRPAGRLSDVKITASNLHSSSGTGMISSREIGIYKVAYVRIRKPSTYLSTKSGLYPDPIPPYKTTDMLAGKTQPVYLLFYVPQGAAGGIYSGSVKVSPTNGMASTIPVKLTVYRFTIGNRFECRVGFYNPDLVAKAEGVPYLYDGAGLGKAVISRYNKLFIDHKISPFGSWPAIGFKGSNGVWNFYSSYSEYYPSETPNRYFRKYLLEYGSRGYRLPIYWTGDAWVPGPPGSAAANNRLKSVARYFYREKMYGKLYAYPIDEPKEDNVSINRVKSFVKWMNAVTKSLKLPEIPYLLTAEPKPQFKALFPCVDIWVPVIHRFYYNKPYVGQIRKSGKKVWWYTCGGQAQGYSPTLLIDDSPVEARMIAWMAYKEGVKGFLYFNGVRWQPLTLAGTVSTGSLRYRNPWTDPLSFRFGRNIYSNGEGDLVYPGSYAGYSGYSARPVSSLRLERIRDGIEDYEYLYKLQTLGDGAFVRSVLNQLVPSGNPNAFPKVKYSPALFKRIRESVARRIELKLKGR